MRPQRTSQSPEASRRRRPWAPTQPDTASVTPALRSSSPLAVSVSGPSFHPSALGIGVLTSASAAPSSDPSDLGLQSASRTSPGPAPTTVRERVRDYRGKCLYQSRKCENERALKRNGKAHNLCDEHRSKQNQHQRKFDAKKFSRKRRTDSDDEAKSGDDQSRSPEADSAKREPEAEDPEAPRKSTRPLQDAAPVSLAPPQRKIRRFEGAKHAGRRSSSAKTQDPVETETSGLSIDVHALRPPFVPEPFVAPSAGREPSQSYVSPSHAEYAVPGHHAHYHLQHLSYQQHASPYEVTEQPGYFHHRHSDLPVSAAMASNYDARALGPLRPLAAIVATPSARIPVGEPHYHHYRDHTSPEDRGGLSEPHPSQPSVAAVDERSETSRPRGALVERRVPFNTEAAYHQAPQVEMQRPYHVHSHHYRQQQRMSPEALERSAPGAAVHEPKYSNSELMAASILVPDTAPSVRVQYTESVEHTGPQYQHQHPHTSISPRDVAPMHPSTYAISPHHGRLQHPPAAYASADKHLPQYYVRAQQTQSLARRADNERQQHQHQQSDAYTSYHHRLASSPSTAVAPQYVAPGPSRMLPALATRVATAQPPSSIPGVPPRAYAPPPQYQHLPPSHAQSMRSSRHSPPPPQFAPALPSLRSCSATDLTQHYSPPTTSSL